MSEEYIMYWGLEEKVVGSDIFDVNAPIYEHQLA